MIDPVLLAVAPCGLIVLTWGVTSRIRSSDYVPSAGRAVVPASRALPVPSVTGEVIHTVTAEVVRPPALVAAETAVDVARAHLASAEQGLAAYWQGRDSREHATVTVTSVGDSPARCALPSGGSR